MDGLQMFGHLLDLIQDIKGSGFFQKSVKRAIVVPYRKNSICQKCKLFFDKAIVLYTLVKKIQKYICANNAFPSEYSKATQPGSRAGTWDTTNTLKFRATKEDDGATIR